MRVLFITTSLATGGAELMLCKLLRELPRDQLQPTVVSLGPVGRPAKLLEAAGIEVVELGLPRVGNLLLFPITALRLLRRVRPQLIQGWMYHGNLAAWLLAALTGFKARLFWGIRQSLYSLGHEKRLTQWVIKASRLASRRPERIIYVSEVSRQQHEAAGFFTARACVIPNGFDVEQVRRDPKKRAELRARWNLAERDVVVGHLARFHPMKDQLTLIRAARDVAQFRPNVRFALAGPGLDRGNETLSRAIADCGLSTKVMLLGATDDPTEFLSAIDVFCLASAWGEGFPNALGEAMACQAPAVVTRIGECAEIVGEFGRVVAPGDPGALACSLIELIDLDPEDRSSLGQGARRRIARKYSISRVALSYQQMYQSQNLGDAPVQPDKSANDHATPERWP